jgi:hypothetical protein
MNKKLLLLLIFFIALSFTTKAQNSNLSKGNKWDWDDDWQHWKGGNPFIELNLGIGKLDHKKIFSKLSDVGSLEIKLGFAALDEPCEEGIQYFNEKYTFLSKMSTSFRYEKRKYTELPSELLRFGFGKRNGYGYVFENIKIKPYVLSAFSWAKLEMKDYPASILQFIGAPRAIDDTEILKRYDGNFRFGSLAEGGISLRLGIVSLNAGYETAVIFPRYVFWKHIGSFAIEMIGLNALDKFIDEVIDASPAAGPIVNFLLKNGYNFAFYTLKKDKMNWPFDSESPLTYETFKLGVTFTF